jgi:hypothetical protein
MPTPLLRRFVLAATLVLFSAFARSAEILLYDGKQNNLPQNQPWLVYMDDSLLNPPAPPQNVVAGTGVRMSTSGAGAAGYFNHLYFFNWFPVNSSFPALNPADGFNLSFQLQIHAENHTSNNRAGFSVILLGMDVLGIELGFWENRIWAQSGPSFTQAEYVKDFDTTPKLIDYELLILNSEYFLRADGIEILTGPTRDYSPASPFPDPYDTPNMLYLGDNTGSARANFTLGSILLRTGPFDLPAPVPAPAPYALLLPAVAWLVRRRTRLSACPTSGPRQPPRSLQARHHTRSGQGTQRGSDA